MCLKMCLADNMSGMKKMLMLMSLFLVLVISPAHAATHDYIAERAYFEDASNTLTWPDVKQKSFEPFAGMFTKSYSQSAFWIRLKVSPVPKQAGTSSLVLKIQPSYLDEIRLYDPAQPEKLERVVGDRYPYANNERKSLTYDFLIPSSSEPRYVWLRLKTTSTNLMQLSVVDAQDAQKIDRFLENASTAIFSVLVVFMLWAFIHWRMNKERLMRIFLMRQLLGIFFLAAYVGYFRILFEGLLAPSTLDFALSFFVLSSTAVAFWFHGEFFKDYLIDPRLQGVFTVIIWLFPIEMLLFAAGSHMVALKINMMVVMLMPLFMFLLSIFAVPWAKLTNAVSVLPRPYLILAHASYLLLTSLTTLPSLGLASGSIFSPHAVLLHAFVTAIVLMAVIFYRAKRIEERRIQEVIASEQKALNEKAKREEQGRFLEMLTHEVKTSLAVLKMALGSVDLASKEGNYANRAIDSMNDVIERCAQVQVLNDEQVAIALDEINLVELLRTTIASTHSPERIALACEMPIKVRSDEKLLKVIFSNLMDNALKYSPPKSVVNIVVKADMAQVAVTVTNQVGNAGKPDKNKVFTKYYRSERAHEQIGSGLGLYLTDQFARMLGMQLNYVTKPDVVEFELCLKRSA